MFGKIKIAAVSCLVAALILSGCNGAKGPTVYATVNGQDITRDDYQLYENFLLLPQQVELTREDQEQILQDLVDLKVYVAEAEKRGFEPDIDLVETDFKAYRQQILGTEMFAGSLTIFYARLQEYGLSEDWIIQLYKEYQIVNAMIDAEEAKAKAPDSEDIEAYYEKEKETTFSHDELRRVRHILVNGGNFPDSEDEDVASEVKELATSLFERLKAGEDFALLAKEYSQDGSATLGGDIGFVGKDSVVQSFAEAAFSAELNVVVPPVESQYGWHILEVTEIKAAGYYELDEDMREQIADSLLKTEQQTLVENLLLGLKEDADIKIKF
jgi:parvulin-like peptidyl-prolyl isomerase